MALSVGYRYRRAGKRERSAGQALPHPQAMQETMMSQSMSQYFGDCAIQLTEGRMSVLDQGQGLPVLLGHGFLWDRAMWAPQIAALSRHCRVLVPYMWGHGASAMLPRRRSLADLAHHMVELLDQLEIDRCVVAGSSMGGMWAAHLAARAPQRVVGLVIMNSSLGAEPAAQRATYAAILDQVAADGAVSDRLADLIFPLFFAGDIDQRAAPATRAPAPTRCLLAGGAAKLDRPAWPYHLRPVQCAANPVADRSAGTGDRRRGRLRTAARRERGHGRPPGMRARNDSRVRPHRYARTARTGQFRAARFP